MPAHTGSKKCTHRRSCGSAWLCTRLRSSARATSARTPISFVAHAGTCCVLYALLCASSACKSGLACVLKWPGLRVRVAWPAHRGFMPAASACPGRSTRPRTNAISSAPRERRSASPASSSAFQVSYTVMAPCSYGLHSHGLTQLWLIWLWPLFFQPKATLRPCLPPNYGCCLCIVVAYVVVDL